jgi:serine/threonine-protein kinase
MIGRVVGQYKVIEKLGAGGMSSVFKAVDLMLAREVAIKVLRSDIANQPEVIERFRTEAAMLAKLNHPNIATVHAFFREEDDFFMVMELLSGETLAGVIYRSGAMTWEQAMPLFVQVLDGIAHAHRQGIIHRDLKPGNIMLTDAGVVKIMDFGIARMMGTERMTRDGRLIGTLEYMSPEQIQRQEADARSDIYSLGVVLYEMLTGRLPFTGTSDYELMKSQVQDTPLPPTSFAPQIPVPVAEAIMQALAKDPDARFHTAPEFLSTLENGGPLKSTVVRSAMPVSPPLTVGLSEPLATRVLSEAPPAETGDGQPVDESAISSTAESQLQTPAWISFFVGLGWKRYAGIAAVLVVLIGGLVGAVGLRKGPGTDAPDPNSPSAITQPDLSGPGAPAADQAKPVGADSKVEGLSPSRGTASSSTKKSPTATQPAGQSRDDNLGKKIVSGLKKIGGFFAGGDDDKKAKKKDDNKPEKQVTSQ